MRGSRKPCAFRHRDRPSGRWSCPAQVWALYTRPLPLERRATIGHGQRLLSGEVLRFIMPAGWPIWSMPRSRPIWVRLLARLKGMIGPPIWTRPSRVSRTLYAFRPSPDRTPLITLQTQHNLASLHRLWRGDRADETSSGYHLLQESLTFWATEPSRTTRNMRALRPIWHSLPRTVNGRSGGHIWTKRVTVTRKPYAILPRKRILFITLIRSNLGTSLILIC